MGKIIEIIDNRKKRILADLILEKKKRPKNNEKIFSLKMKLIHINRENF
jgi:hypothetical protein